MTRDDTHQDLPDVFQDVVDVPTPGARIDPADIDPEDRDLARTLAADQHAQAREALRAGWEQLDLEQAQAALRRLYGWRLCLNALSDTTPEGLTFHIDALVLADCYRSLFADPSVETIVYLTGVELSDAEVTLNRRIPIAHAEQSAGRAAGDPDASFETLRELDRTGHRLLAHCHNHPGASGTAPTPSQDDRDYQARLEDGEYTPLGIIMAKDGYVRLFTNDIDFDVEIHGTHVERLGDHRFHLAEELRTATARLDSA